MSKDRLAKLRERLAKHKLDAIFISSPETNSPVNRRYLSGFTGTSAYLLISHDDAVIATDFRYYEQAAQQASGFRLLKAVGASDTWLPELLAGLGGKRLAFESANISYQGYRILRKAVQSLDELKRPKLVATTNIVEAIR